LPRKRALAQTARAATLLANADADGAIETATQAIGLEPGSARRMSCVAPLT
jgi:hypothetical protein